MLRLLPHDWIVLVFSCLLVIVKKLWEIVHQELFEVYFVVNLIEIFFELLSVVICRPIRNCRVIDRIDDCKSWEKEHDHQKQFTALGKHFILDCQLSFVRLARLLCIFLVTICFVKMLQSSIIGKEWVVFIYILGFLIISVIKRVIFLSFFVTFSFKIFKFSYELFLITIFAIYSHVFTPSTFRLFHD
jgi:hypothetical protein